MAALIVAAGLVLALLAFEIGVRRLDSRRLALLAALAAIDAGFRLVVITGIGGFNPIWLPVLCAGYVMGPSFGFLAGALGLMVSAVASGGIGSWLPYQVLGCGGVGAAAGLVRGRGLPALAAVGFLSGYAFGAFMDVWDWNVFYGGSIPFGRFYLTTSLVYDSFRAVGNVLLVALLGPPLVAALERVRRRLTYVVVPS